MEEVIDGGRDRTGAVDPQEVRAQLARILADRSFVAAPQLSRLLKQLVEAALSGDAREVKEYALGVELFGRGTSFDPKIDNIVRSHAHRLRRRLEEYFDGPGRTDPVVIEIPKGHYIASFRIKPTIDVATAPTSTARRGARTYLTLIGVPALIGVPVLLAALAVTFLWRQDHMSTASTSIDASVAVLPLVVMSNDPELRHLGHAFAEEITNQLTSRPNLKVTWRNSAFLARNSDAPTIGRSLAVSYVVEGSIRSRGEGLRATIQLVRTRDGYHVWSSTYDLTYPVNPKERQETLRTVGWLLYANLFQDRSLQLRVAKPTMTSRTTPTSGRSVCAGVERQAERSPAALALSL